MVMQLALPAYGRWATARGLKAQEIVYLVMRLAEARRRVKALEPEHRTGALLDGSGVQGMLASKC
jgi:hypothetical protein